MGASGEEVQVGVFWRWIDVGVLGECEGLNACV